MVDAGATSHITRGNLKIKTKHFSHENNYMKLADRTKTSIVALKRGDAEMCLLNVDGNHVMVTLKKALPIPS